MNFSVLGCGRWGSFISWYLSGQGHDVMLWGRADGESYQILNTTRKNEYVQLADNIKLTSDLKSAVDAADCVVISISAQGLRKFASQLVSIGLGDKIVILCMKGMEESSGKRLSEVCVESGVNQDNLAVWLGPGHIQDFINGIPNCMLIDSSNPSLTVRLATMLNSDLIRFYFGTDIIGNEIGGATKNIIGITAGMLDGIGYSSLKGPLMSRGTTEIARLIGAMGGDPRSAFGLAHLGDYETTLFSKYSNNRAFGESWAKGEPYKKLAEGVATTKAVKLLADKLGVDMPIVSSTYRVLFEGADAKSEIEKLYRRVQKPQV